MYVRLQQRTFLTTGTTRPFLCLQQIHNTVVYIVSQGQRANKPTEANKITLNLQQYRGGQSLACSHKLQFLICRMMGNKWVLQVRELIRSMLHLCNTSPHPNHRQRGERKRAARYFPVWPLSPESPLMPADCLLNRSVLFEGGKEEAYIFNQDEELY